MLLYPSLKIKARKSILGIIVGSSDILKFCLELQGPVCKEGTGPQEFQVFYSSKFQLCGMHEVSTLPKFDLAEQVRS